MSIEDVRTMSAPSMASSDRGSTFMSTRVNSQSSGSSAATVSSPSGGRLAFLPMNGRAYLKLQYVGGISG